MQLQPHNSANTLLKAYVAVGSNQSSGKITPKDTLRHALGLFLGESLEITKQSQWYETEAFPPGSGPDYVNAVVEIETVLPVAEILPALHQIETAMGRQRTARWGQRSCDLDLLAVGDAVAPNPHVFTHWHSLPIEQQMVLAPDQLILPHPRLQDRAFVLVPLNDIAPEWHHPVLGRTVAQMLADLPKADVTLVRQILT